MIQTLNINRDTTPSRVPGTPLLFEEKEGNNWYSRQHLYIKNLFGKHISPPDRRSTPDGIGREVVY